MKNRKIFLISCAFFAVIFMLFSCKNTVSIEQKEDAQESNIKQLENPVLKFTLQDESQNERTIKPNIKAADLTDFILEGKKVSDADYSELATYTDATEIMSASYAFKTNQIGQKWSFRLTAKNGALAFTAITNEITLEGGENLINFELIQNNLGDANGTGSINVTLNFANAENAENVKLVKAKIYRQYASGSDYYYLYWDDKFGENEENPITNGTITLSKDDIPVGEYKLVFSLNGDNSIKLLEWTECLHVAEGHVSSKEIIIDAVNELYTVTFMLDKDDESPVTKKVSRYSTSSDVLYKTESRTDYLFTGWYIDSACKQPVEFPIEKDITLYAGWVSVNQGEGVYAVNDRFNIYGVLLRIKQSSRENPAVIKLFGEWYMNSLIESFNYWLQKTPDVYVKLDASEAVINFEYFNEKNYDDKIDNIVEIIFPESLKESDKLYLNCFTGLRTVSFAGENPAFYVQDNVVYSRNGELLSYLPCNTCTSFEVPDFVKVIRGYAFHGCNNLTSLKFKKENISICTIEDNPDINDVNTVTLLTGKRIDNKDTLLSDLIDGTNSNYYIANSQINMTPIYKESNKITKLYRSESWDVSDGSYLVVDTEEPYVIYRFDAEIGTDYKVNFLNSSRNWRYSNCPEILTDCSIHILDGNGNPIASGKYYDDYEFAFAAVTETIYIIVKQQGPVVKKLNNIGCAFALRVMDNKNILSVNNSGNEIGLHVNIDTSLIPEGATSRKFYLDGLYISSTDKRVNESEWVYPFVTAGKTYNLKVEFNGNGVNKSSELSITPTSGLGDYYFDNTDHTIVNNVLIFDQQPVLKTTNGNEISTVPAGYAFDIGEKNGDYLGWHGWYTFDQVNGFDFSKKGVIRESSRDKEIWFDIWYCRDLGYGDDFIFYMMNREYFTLSN